MHTIYIYHPDSGIRCEGVDRKALQSALTDANAVVWVDLEEPTDDEMDILVEEFQFHPLSIEDCIFPQNRPKLEEFEDYTFIVFHGIQYNPENTHPISTQELDIFLGKNFLVTVHDNPLKNVVLVKQRCREKAEVLSKGSDYILYLVLDNLVDSYFPLLDQMDREIDEIEDTVFTKPTADLLNHMFSLKRALMSIRRVINPQREIIVNVSRRDVKFIRQETLIYFRDIYDHLFRMTDSIDTYREILGNAFDAYLSVTSNQLNAVMKTLTIITTIMMPGTLIASIYGMNFEYMPHLHWKYGPHLVVLLIISITGTMLYYFRKKNWI
jgi:magnesium transporter